MGMFEVDKEGLAQILARRGVQFAVLELIQNALDESGVKKILVCLLKSETRGYFHLTVTDDAPDGFADLSHAYTLFASSNKKDNPEQRGRFNLGEKLVLACTRSASIKTTKGTVYFENGERRNSREKTEQGSVISVEIKMTQEEARETEKAVNMVICPLDVEMIFNDHKLKERSILGLVKTNLPTERADEEGFLRPTRRDTVLSVYAVRSGEKPTLFEMGIPVVELDCAWHVNIGQKVPLNMDRDNVTPAYRRMVLTTVVNLMHESLSQDAIKEPWVDEALTSPDLDSEAVRSVLTARYGDKRVIADPSDPEGTKLAVSQGYQVIQAGSFSKPQWDNIRRSGAALPAGQVTPSPKPWSSDPNAPQAKRIDRRDWTEDMTRVSNYVEEVAARLVEPGIKVEFYSTTNAFSAAFGSLKFQFNLMRLGHKYFENALSSGFEELNRLVIHELGHYYSLDHLSDQYHDALCKLGAKFTQLALEESSFFERHRY